jgi:peptide/nickel transport system substrate-binding protein
MRHSKVIGFMLSVVLVVGLWAAPAVMADEKPRRGGILNAALAANPPSLDMHQEQTFAVAQPLGPIYNNLIVFDPHNYPQIIGDLAKGWTVSADYLTYTFTLHQGVTFHDGSPLTSADVKASWDRIIFPPEGVVSPRRGNYPMVKSIEAPDPYTVVFHLQHRSPSFLINLAHPASFIYAKKYLDEDQQWYKKNTMGSGPFKLKQYVHGASFEMERNAKYWKPGLPYMDGIKYYIITDDGARGKAIRAGRVDVELRFLPPGEVDGIKAQMGDKVVVAAPKSIGNFGVTFNVDKKPFDDERVRKALSLALDRYDMVTTLRPFTVLDAVGGMMHPDSQWTLSEEELQQFPGFGKDHEANLKEAKRLLAEAGYPNGFKTVLTNRNIKIPYIDLAVYVISAWRKIGVEAEHKVEESATYSKTRVARDFELLLDPYGSQTVGDPDELLDKFITGASENWGRFSDPVVDKLYEQQSREMDEQKRIELVKQIDRRILEKVWRIQGLWTNRLEVRSAKIRNYTPQPSHWMNRRFEDVWLAEK